jgi:hypothetical protein
MLAKKATMSTGTNFFSEPRTWQQLQEFIHPTQPTVSGSKRPAQRKSRMRMLTERKGASEFLLYFDKDASVSNKSI